MIYGLSAALFGEITLKDGAVEQSNFPDYDAVIPIAVRKDAGGNSVAEGNFTIKRLDYRIGDGQWADPDTVANEVVVRVRMVLPPVQ